MEAAIVEKNGRKYLRGVAGQELMIKASDVSEIINMCFDGNASGIMLFAENFPDNFFKLSSGEAGEILQKFRNYMIKVAAVLPQEMLSNGVFGRMASEENRSTDFRLFTSVESAEKWILQE